jgi:glycosyltransferase involved in cell wall biosynthesis
MKICYIANSKSSHTVKWAKHFIDLGHEVHVISHSQTEIPGAYVHYINYSIRNFLIKVREVHNLIRKINPDVIHAHQANTCGLYAASLKNYKIIVSAWGSDILIAPRKSKIMKKIVQYVISKAYFITSDSQNMTDRIVELGGNRDKCYTFPMGVEKELLRYFHKVSENDSTLKILSNRRLEKIYNIDIIIKGFKRALEVVDDIKLTISADGTESNYLKKLVEELTLQQHVIFTGRYTFDDLCLMLEGNDVFISIPASDSTSVSLLEAMCCGVYPVLCDLPANKEWVNDGENGIIIEDTTEKAVCDAILWCYNNKACLKQASAKNRDIIREKALWENNVKIVEKLYNKIIELKIS